MGNAAAALISTLDDDAWDDLLSFIEERRVIPIVGPELLLVSTERGPRLLLDWVAEKLAGRLNVNIAELPQPYTLNDVVCWFLSARGRREEAYVRMRSIIKEANFEPPAALRRLRCSRGSCGISWQPAGVPRSPVPNRPSPDCALPAFASH